MEWLRAIINDGLGISNGESPPSPERRRDSVPAPLGFSFSPGGLVFPYHMGVAETLMALGVISDKTPISGSSAGALIAAYIGGKIPFRQTKDAIIAISEKVTNHSMEQEEPKGDLASWLQEELWKLMDGGTVHRINKRPAKVTIGYTRVWPLPVEARFVDNFSSASDLIECITASCMIPFYLTSHPSILCRGEYAIDGWFATSIDEFGCPPAGGLKDVKVICFRNVDKTLRSLRDDIRKTLAVIKFPRCAEEPEHNFCDIAISPDILSVVEEVSPLEIEKYWKLRRKRGRFFRSKESSRHMDTSNVRGMDGATLAEVLLRGDMKGNCIPTTFEAAGVLPSLTDAFSIVEMGRLALFSDRDQSNLEFLFECGSADAYRWAVRCYNRELGEEWEPSEFMGSSGTRETETQDEVELGTW